MNGLYLHMKMTGQLVGPFEGGQDEVDWFMNQMECEGIETQYLDYEVVDFKFEVSPLTFYRSQLEVAHDMAEGFVS